MIGSSTVTSSGSLFAGHDGGSSRFGYYSTDAGVFYGRSTGAAIRAPDQISAFLLALHGAWAPRG